MPDDIVRAWDGHQPSSYPLVLSRSGPSLHGTPWTERLLTAHGRTYQGLWLPRWVQHVAVATVSPRDKRAPNHIGVQSPLACAIPGSAPQDRTSTEEETVRMWDYTVVSYVVGSRRTRRGGLSHRLHKSKPWPITP